MKKKSIMSGSGRAAAILMAALLGLTGCGGQSGSGSQGGAGQSSESGTNGSGSGSGTNGSGSSGSGTNGAETNGSGSGSQHASGGLSTNAEPAVRELYDIMTVPFMRLQAYGDNADAALDLGVEKIRSINDLLSTGDPESEIGKLNDTGSGVIGEDAAYLLETSLELYEETGGAFDVSVYPLMELWGFTNLYQESLEEAIEQAEKKAKDKAAGSEGDETGGSEDDETDGSEDDKTGGSGEEADESGDMSEGTGGAEDEAAAGSGTREAPSEADIQATLTKVDASKIRFNVDTNQVDLPEGMKIDFGGIAKGYASQSVAEILRDAGVTSALMDLGGNIQAVGRKPDGSKWRIALNDRNHGGFLGILTVENCAVITSGGYERNFEDAEGNVYHHIIDPKTGYPVNNGFSTNASVTIVCEDGTMADALSTAMYVCGPEKAEEYWREHSDEFQMIMMTDENKMYVTEGIADDYQSDYKFKVIKK